MNLSRFKIDRHFVCWCISSSLYCHGATLSIGIYRNKWWILLPWRKSRFSRTIVELIWRPQEDCLRETDFLRIWISYVLSNDAESCVTRKSVLCASSKLELFQSSRSPSTYIAYESLYSFHCIAKFLVIRLK